MTQYDLRSEEARRDPGGGRRWFVNLGVLALGVVILALFVIFYHFFFPQDEAARKKGKPTYTVIQRHANKPAKVKKALSGDLDVIIKKRRATMDNVTVMLNDVPHNGEIDENTGEFVLALQVTFYNDFKIETRAVRTDGKHFLRTTSDLLRRAQARYDELMKKGQLNPKDTGKLYLD